MGVTMQITGLILSLSIIVILHELGHFGFSKLFKARIEKFYLFFNAWIYLVRARKENSKWKFSFFKRNNETENDAFETTEYGIGWLPLGGYVKIAGMIDESLDTKQLKQEPKPYEFRAKPAWQRLFIMLGGVLVNFVLALFIYSMILFVWGQEYVPASNAEYGVVCDSLAFEAGLKNGDKILKVGNFNIDQLVEVGSHILIDKANTITVDRNGEIITLNIPDGFRDKMMKTETVELVDFSFPFVIDSVLAGNFAEKAGMLKNDKLIEIDTVKTPSAYEFMNTLALYSGKTINITVERNGETKKLLTEVSSHGKIGVGYKQAHDFFPTKRIEYGFLASFPAGISLGIETLVKYIKQLKLIFTREGVKQIGGFGTIGSIFPKTWNWAVFWEMTAFLSVILAFMNVLPIPALDGGHVLFTLFEMITGKKPGDKFLEIAQISGMIILFTLLIYANFNDVLRWIGK